MTETKSPRAANHREIQRDILVVLLGLDAPNGRRVQDELSLSTPDGVERAPVVYQNLDRLVEEGLVEKRDAGRDNEYSLTREGRELIESHHDWQSQYFDQA